MFDDKTGRLLVQEAAIKNNSNLLKCKDGSEYTFQKELHLKTTDVNGSNLNKSEYYENAPKVMSSTYQDFMHSRKRILDDAEEEKRRLEGHSFEEKLKLEGTRKKSSLGQDNLLSSILHTVDEVRMI